METGRLSLISVTLRRCETGYRQNQSGCSPRAFEVTFVDRLIETVAMSDLGDTSGSNPRPPR